MYVSLKEEINHKRCQWRWEQNNFSSWTHSFQCLTQTVLLLGECVAMNVLWWWNLFFHYLHFFLSAVLLMTPGHVEVQGNSGAWKAAPTPPSPLSSVYSCSPSLMGSQAAALGQPNITAAVSRMADPTPFKPVCTPGLTMCYPILIQWRTRLPKVLESSRDQIGIIL